MSNPAIKIAIYCNGGVVTAVSTDAACDVEVLVCDYDESEDMEGEFEDSEARADAYESSLSFADGTSFDDFAKESSWVH